MDFPTLTKTICEKMLERVKVHDPAATRDDPIFVVYGETIFVDFRSYGENRIAIRKHGYGKHQQRIRSDEGGEMPDHKIEEAVKWLLAEVDGIRARKWPLLHRLHNHERSIQARIGVPQPRYGDSS